MALNIKSIEADRLARELAEELGESLTRVVTQALREKLARVQRRTVSSRGEAIREIREVVSSLSVLDDRSVDELLGYRDNGTFE